MFRPFPLFIGLRYVRARRRTRFISVVSAVALLGLALGVMALLVVLSVMNGFDRELRTRILSMVPHVLVHAAHPLQDWEPLATALEQDPAVVGVAPEDSASPPSRSSQSPLTPSSSRPPQVLP